MKIPEEAGVVAVAALLQQAASARAAVRAAALAPAHALPFLQPGRLVRVLTGGDGSAAAAGARLVAAPAQLLAEGAAGVAQDPGQWGVVINFERIGKKGSDNRKASPCTAGFRTSSCSLLVSAPDARLLIGVCACCAHQLRFASFTRRCRDLRGRGTAMMCTFFAADAAGGTVRASRAAYIVDVLVNCEPGSSGGVGPAKAPRLLPAGAPGSPLVVPFPLDQVRCASLFLQPAH